MSAKTGDGPPPALLALVAGYAVWAVVVLYITSTVALPQRAIVAGTLLAIGALVGGMGYLSTLRRRAMRARQDSLQRILEKRRKERGNGNG